MTKRHRQIATIFYASLLAAACAPLHTVKPLPDFVKTGIEPGDTVTVETRSGEEHEFIVREVRENRLSGDDAEFLLKDLVSIKKHAWSRPKSPCGGDLPLGCSVPWLVALTSEAHGHYKEVFYDACAQHDYCYRHGFASYGVDRTACDEAFLVDMKNLCPKPAASGVGKVFEIMDDSVESRQTCEMVADDYYAAVKRYGADRFLTTASTYCEYDGPPSGKPSSANASTSPGRNTR